MHFLILSSASLYFYLLLLPTIFFYVNKVKRSILFQISYFRKSVVKKLRVLSFIPQNKPVSITLFTHALLSYLVYHSVLRTSLFLFCFCFSYTYSRLSVLCGYLTFEISNFPSSLERKCLQLALEKISIPKANLCSCLAREHGNHLPERKFAQQQHRYR